MTVSRPCYASRERVMRATDIKFTARMIDAVDRAIESASESIDSLCHRRFYNIDTTQRWDWPNFQRAYPWRLWFDEREIADVTVNVPIVYAGTQLIPANQIFWGPWNYAPPYTFMELDRSTNAAFGFSATPQRDITITATYGYALQTQPAGNLAAAVSDTTGTSVTVSSSIYPGVGDVMIVDSERMLVQDRSMVSTGQTQQGAGCSTNNNADVTLAVTDGTKYALGETLLLDSERMLIVDIAGNNITVSRAWDGTVLATHTGATIYAPRVLTVIRGAYGTTAATHLNNAPVTINLPPPQVRDLVLAESVVQTLEETGGYTGSHGSGQGKVANIGSALASDLGISRDKVQSRFGRKARHRVV